jgi:hypothetical protein
VPSRDRAVTGCSSAAELVGDNHAVVGAIPTIQTTVSSKHDGGQRVDRHLARLPAVDRS